MERLRLLRWLLFSAAELLGLVRTQLVEVAVRIGDPLDISKVLGAISRRKDRDGHHLTERGRAAPPQRTTTSAAALASPSGS
jgi:hypothetical protein